MSDEKEKSRMWLTTENPAIMFENTDVGRLKKEVWEASEEEIERQIHKTKDIIKRRNEIFRKGQNFPRTKSAEDFPSIKN
ncbi:hypothetical protein LCGC14_2499940, partial [marine sediment metagenome]